MKAVFLTVLAMSLSGTLAYVLVKLLSLLGGRKINQSWRYWALFGAGLLFAAPLHRLWRAVPSARVAVSVAPSVRMGVRALASTTSARVVGLGRYLDIAAAVWLAVSLALIVWNIIRLVRCRRLLERGGVQVDARLTGIAGSEAERVGVRKPVRLLVSPAVQSPVLVGWFTPVVLLPRREFDEAGLRLILKHELAHFKRLDLWKKLMFTFLRCLHWFNPAVYLLSRDFSYRMETACDERVVHAMDRTGRKTYGYLLIDCAPNLRREAAVGFVSFASCRKKMERRITTMMKSNKKASTVLGIVLAMTLLAGCLAVTALAAGANSEVVKIDSDDAITVDLKDVEITEDPDLSDNTISYVIIDPETGEEIIGETVAYKLSGINLSEAAGESDTVTASLNAGNCTVTFKTDGDVETGWVTYSAEAETGDVVAVYDSNGDVYNLAPVEIGNYDYQPAE